MQGKIVLSNDYAKTHVINLTKLFERNIFILKMRSDSIKKTIPKLTQETVLAMRNLNLEYGKL